MTPLIGLAMIVRDEEAVLGRCLGSLLDLIDTWTICDTGSTDSTPETVRLTLRSAGLPGRLYRHKWRDFGHNRNLAQQRARGTARWILRADADWTFETAPGFRQWLAEDPDPGADAWMVEVEDAGVSYWLPLLVRGDQDWHWTGATHEYLDTSGRVTRHVTGLRAVHHADGSSRAVKFERDLELLAPAVERGDARATYYTAETLRCLGRNDEAAELYERRATMGGWDEEAWHAQFQAARLRRSVPALVMAWQRRPWRHEPLTEAARIAASDERAAGDVLFREPAPAT